MNRIARTLTATVAGLALGFGPVVAAAPAAAIAGTPKYVTKAEFNKIHKGMTIRQVERMFGVRSVKRIWPDGAPGLQYRDYRAKGEAKGAWVHVGYKKVDGTFKVTFWEGYWPWKNRNPADHRGRVTKAKFDKVRAGMDIGQAHRILGTKGDLGIACSKWGNYQTRLYREESDAGAGYAVLYKKVNGKWHVHKKGAGPMAHYKKGNPFANPG